MTASVSVPMPVLIAQWVLLGGLGFLVILMYRQLSYLMQIGRNTSADAGLALGELAPPFAYEPVRVPDAGTRTFEPVGSPAIVLFADPACPSCERAISALDAVIGRRRPDDLRVLVVTHAPTSMIEDFDAFQNTSLEVGRAERDVLGHLYQSGVTPIFFGVDAAGVVRGKAVADQEHDIEQLIVAVSADVREADALTGLQPAGLPGREE